MLTSILMKTSRANASCTHMMVTVLGKDYQYVRSQVTTSPSLFSCQYCARDQLYLISSWAKLIAALIQKLNEILRFSLSNSPTDSREVVFSDSTNFIVLGFLVVLGPNPLLILRASDCFSCHT